MSAPASFVGRHHELAVLDACLAAARAGSPQVVYVEGEPGTGKSTLLSRFIGSVQDAVVLEVSGDEAEMLLSYGIINQLPFEAATEPGTDPMAVGAQLVDLLDRLQADDQVGVLVIDDLQWADRPSSRAVLFAVRRLRADRVLIVASSRTGGLIDPGWARFTAGDSRVTRLKVGGLSSGELAELAGQLGLGTLTERGAARLVAHTEGNPLYSRALLEEIGVGGLSDTSGVGLPAPRELSAVILARIGALPAAAQTFLRAAAVVGHHASASSIAAVAQLADAEPEVEAAVAAGLLVRGPSISEVSFGHPLYRAAIYADLPATLRRDLHTRAADLVAGRARFAHLVAAAAGPDEDLANELEESAQVASAASNSDASAWAMEQAAALSPRVEDRERRLLDAASILLSAADTTAARQILDSCRVPSARRDALTGLLQVFTGALTAGDLLTAAWQDHDPLTETEIGARAATSLTNWMVMSGQPDQALSWAERAVTGTVEGSALRAMAYTGQAYALAAAARSHDGLGVLDFLPASGNEAPISATDALIMRGILKVYTDDLPGAIADLGVAAARLQTGLPSTYPVPCLATLSDAHFRRGDWDAATAHARLATSLAQDTDRPLDLARAHARAGQVLACRGQWLAAQAHVAAARAATERLPLVLTMANTATAAVALASARGDLMGVLSAAEPVRATHLLGVGGRPGVFGWRAAETDALIRLGRLDDAQIALDAFEESIPNPGLPSAELAVARCRGNLAAARGDKIHAEAAFDRAHLIKAGVLMPFEHALLGLDHGRYLRRDGNGSGAIAQLEHAHRLFSDLGADPYLQACSEELAELRVDTTAASPAVILGLSRAELAVARLVATGLTNREVASQLFLSVKTVEYHLRNTYLKLDLSSRRELSALLR